jgi:electron transfer flavoprotein alpha subunit
MSNVLIVVEVLDGKLRNASLPGITAGQQLARAMGGQLHLLVLAADAAAAAANVAAAGYGAAVVHAGSHAGLEPFTAEAWGDAIANVVRALQPAAVGGTATSTTRDALPRAAALLGAPMVGEVTAVKGADTFARAIAAGRAVQDVKVSGTPFFFTARGSEFEPAAAAGPTATSAVAVGTIDARGAEVVSIEKSVSTRPALTEADVIVSGGRGMKEGANFKILEELTDLLGGALGASRAATDAGMVPADLQVGQTGKVVAPNLYIAVAISGAIQHLAGMKSSKTIVAINKDPEAPIFQVADYGLVGKWEEAVPALIQAVRARKGA